MPNREQIHHLNIVATIAADTGQTGTVTGDGVEVTDYDAAMFAVVADAVSVADTVTQKLQESDDDSTYTDVAEGDFIRMGGNNVAGPEASV